MQHDSDCFLQQGVTPCLFTARSLLLLVYRDLPDIQCVEKDPEESVGEAVGVESNDYFCSLLSFPAGNWPFLKLSFFLQHCSQQDMEFPLSL